MSERTAPYTASAPTMRQQHTAGDAARVYAADIEGRDYSATAALARVRFVDRDAEPEFDNLTGGLARVTCPASLPGRLLNLAEWAERVPLDPVYDPGADLRDIAARLRDLAASVTGAPRQSSAPVPVAVAESDLSARLRELAAVKANAELLDGLMGEGTVTARVCERWARLEAVALGRVREKALLLDRALEAAEGGR